MSLTLTDGESRAIALLPIQAQKSNSRVMNFDSQLSRRPRGFNPLTHALFVRRSGRSEITRENNWSHVCICLYSFLFCSGGFEPSDPRIKSWYKSDYSEICAEIIRHVCI